MRFVTILVLSLALLSCIRFQRVAATYEEEGWFSSLGNRISGWMPFSSRLGHDWSETQDKMESIYRRNHDLAKERVDALKEEAVERANLQEKIAEIYQQAAMKAEKEIEGLKHGLMEKLTSWRYHGGEPTEHEKKGFLERWGLKKPPPQPSELLPRHLWEDTSRKISEGYRQAVDTAKSKLGEAGATMGTNWEDVKRKTAHAYSEAFHKGHGEARSRLGQLRDVMERGFSGMASSAKNMASEAWYMFTHSLTALTSLGIGALGAVFAMQWIGKRRFRKQLNTHVSGPVMAIGEYFVPGNEEKQRKFFDYWTSGPGGTYFNRQPGMRRWIMHRGVGVSNNEWVCYSEWASIDDLRRAKQSNEFCEIKKQAPTTLHKMMVVQMTSSNEGGGVVGKEGVGAGAHDTSGLRQRTTPSATTSSSTTQRS